MPYYITPETTINILKIFTLGTLSFVLAFWLTPILTHFLYKYKLWRKTVRTKSIDGKEVPFFQKFHSKGETHTPRFGGVLILMTPLLLAALFWGLAKTDIWWFQKLNFLSREQTWLLFFALIASSLLGFLDDILQVVETPSRPFLKKIWQGIKKYIGGGLSLKYRLSLMGLIGLIGGWWLYAKLGLTTIHIPGNGNIEIGIFYILLFVITMLAVYSGGVIDGLDGLAGGSFASIFAAYMGIAIFQGQIDIAAFSAVILGALLAFLWYNIPPARFYMGEIGTMGLCATLTVIAFLTDSVMVLPIIGFLLVVESGSVIIQLFSKKYLGRKVFLAAPIHHHFEAKGWPAYKITMRFWVIGSVMAIFGVAIRLLG